MSEEKRIFIVLTVKKPGNFGRAQLTHGIDHLRECDSLVLFRQLPVADTFDLIVGYTISQLGHGKGTNITAMGENGDQCGAHFLDVSNILTGWR